MDQRHSRGLFLSEFVSAQSADMTLFQRLHGLALDSSGTFNHKPELVLIFGGDFNQTVSGLPFWMIRTAIVGYCGSLYSFRTNSLWRCLRWFDAYRARKLMEI